MSLDFDRVYDLYAPMVYRIGILHFRDNGIAEDLVQDVFVKLFTRNVPFEDDGHMKGWLITVARNLCRNVKAKNARLVQLDENVPHFDKHDSVLAELNKLPAKDRLVIYLHYFEGYTSAEIAHLVGGTAMAVRTRLKRARAALKELLTED